MRASRARARSAQPRHASHLQPEGDVLRHRHVREERIALKDDAEAAAVGLLVRDVAPVEGNPALSRLDETGDHLQGRRLPAARGAEKRNEFALVDRQGDIANGRERAVFLGNPFECQERHSGLRSLQSIRP